MLQKCFGESPRRKNSDYNSKNISHAFVAGFVLAILVKKSSILSRDSVMLKKFKIVLQPPRGKLRKLLFG